MCMARESRTKAARNNRSSAWHKKDFSQCRARSKLPKDQKRMEEENRRRAEELARQRAEEERRKREEEERRRQEEERRREEERRAKEELGKKTSGLMPGPNFHDVWPDVISEDGAVTSLASFQAVVAVAVEGACLEMKNPSGPARAAFSTI
ncbi:unnamed protein product, partial [Cladocopium goreaui]